MEIATEVHTVTMTQIDQLVIHNEATVIKTLYVDQYFRASNTVPYALTTVSTVTGTQVNRNVETATLTNQITTTIESSQSVQSTTSKYHNSSTVALKSSSTASVSSGTPLKSLATTSDDRNTSGTILGLAIGLPIALFVVGLGIVLGFLYYRRSESRKVIDKESLPSHDSNWFVTKLYGEEGIDESNNAQTADEKQNSTYDTGMSSRITYKVSKPYISHPQLIQTPEKVVFTSNPYRELDRSSHKNNGNDNSNSSTGLEQLPKYMAPSFKKWNYESPLSRWFLTKSTLIHDKIQVVKTPTIHLKQLNILSRANESKVTVLGEDPYTEISPMLPNVPQSPFEAIKPLPSPNVRESSQIPVHEYKAHIQHAIVKPQVIDQSVKPVYPTLLKLDKISKTKPLPKPPTMPFTLALQERSIADNVSVRSSFHDVQSARKSTIEEQAISYLVVKDYQAVLMDEINIKKGELVRVLAKHTDGWCLVERISISQQTSLDEPSYLNENRGIVPGLCLQATK
ncbi:unnamed protein product [Kluyveromyces dobzhanskii CBS 2104]|uniref:WGS project CCBQ000000000 data, contig MAT n=1 Tax=Kluyveromyces dobzhanskii CBS 2104 TaxID=1427455 RepID=A0A0A8L3N5_9SACH|nr:unnamed protein product [Kluyveromyces dobzhanskii CBS 2104]